MDHELQSGISNFHESVIQMQTPFRPRRSMLYVPGCDRRYLEKAKALKADSVILDLGDTILLEEKEQ